MKQYGSIHIWLNDNREDEFNESLDMEWPLYAQENDELMTIERWYRFAVAFARGMGFTEETIEEWFGRY